MNNIGIIAGGGKLPITIGKNLIKKNFKVYFFVIEEFFNILNYKDLDVTLINLKSAKKIIESLQAKNIERIIMAGNIKRPSITDLSFDFQTFKLAKNLLLNKTGDNSLLVSIKKYFMDNVFDYFNWKEYCPDLFANSDHLTKLKPTRKAEVEAGRNFILTHTEEFLQYAVDYSLDEKIGDIIHSKKFEEKI